MLNRIILSSFGDLRTKLDGFSLMSRKSSTLHSKRSKERSTIPLYLFLLHAPIVAKKEFHAGYHFS